MKYINKILPLILLILFTKAFAMDKEVISTTEAPKALGPYSQAIRYGNQLFLSGQIALDPQTNTMSTGDIEMQTRIVLSNLKAVLAANGMTMDNVVMSTVYLKDLNDFGKMNAIYAEYFKDKPPARATVQVSALPKDALVEISFIAGK